MAQETGKFKVGDVVKSGNTFGVILGIYPPRVIVYFLGNYIEDAELAELEEVTSDQLDGCTFSLKLEEIKPGMTVSFVAIGGEYLVRKIENDLIYVTNQGGDPFPMHRGSIVPPFRLVIEK